MTIIRTFPTEFALRDDGRTVEGRIVPYNEVAEVTERNAKGEIVTYREQFLRGSCERMVQTAKRRNNAGFIEFRLEHDDVFDSLVGYGKSLREAEDGAYAEFRLYESKDMEKVRSMLAESHNGLSVMFGDVVPPKEIDGVVSRVQVHIRHVAATPVPIYASAGITAIRSDAALALPTPALDSVKQWLASVRGIDE